MMDNFEQSKIIRDVVKNVQSYVRGVSNELGWIAKQSSEEHDDLWGFVIGKGFAAVTITEVLEAKANGTEDALYRRLAAEILGYEPDSRKDLETRRDAIWERIVANVRMISRLQDENNGLADAHGDLELRLTYLPKEG